MRSAAVLTMVRDEDVFLPLWLQYVSRYFRPEDIHVIDHGTDPQILLEARRTSEFETYRVSGPVERYGWMTGILTDRFAQLLKNYEYVLLLDSDEVAIADPLEYRDLRDYIERCRLPAVQLDGREVFHSHEEPPIDLDLPVLAQRRRWVHRERYCKPVLASIPMSWTPGQHASAAGVADPNLLLVHLQKMDYDIWRSRSQRRFGSDFLRQAEDEDLFHATEGSLEVIPDRFRTVF